MTPAARECRRSPGGARSRARSRRARGRGGRARPTSPRRPRKCSRTSVIGLPSRKMLRRRDPLGQQVLARARRCRAAASRRCGRSARGSSPRARASRSSGCRPPCGRSGSALRVATIADRPLLVSPRTSSASGSQREQPASLRAMIWPICSPTRLGPDAQVAVGRGQPELVEEDVGQRAGRSSGRCGRGRGRSRPRRSSRRRGSSRISSGRVPTTVMTFTCRRASGRRGSTKSACAISARAPRRHDRVRRRVLAVAVRRPRPRAASSGSSGSMT